MREEGKEKGREGLSLPLQMSVDGRAKLTCSPHYTYIWGGEWFQQMVDRQTIASISTLKWWSVRPLALYPSSSEHVDTHAQKV